MRHGSEWYKREPAAFLGGVQGLTTKEHAVFSVALDLIYHHGGSINNDPSWIAGWIKDMGPASVRNTISSLVEKKKLIVNGDQITEKRAKNEAKTKENLRETARENGKKGGKKSAEKRAESSKNSNLGEAVASTEKQADKIRLDKTIEESKDSLCGFDDFWGFWPNKTGKENARKAWKKLKIEDKRFAYSAVQGGWFEKWRKAWPQANPIHASSFLNGKRWDDEFGGRLNAPQEKPAHFQQLSAQEQTMALL